MGSIKSMIETDIPGVYVRSLMIGSSVIEVQSMKYNLMLFFYQFTIMELRKKHVPYIGIERYLMIILIKRPVLSQVAAGCVHCRLCSCRPC